MYSKEFYVFIYLCVCVYTRNEYVYVCVYMCVCVCVCTCMCVCMPCHVYVGLRTTWWSWFSLLPLGPKAPPQIIRPGSNHLTAEQSWWSANTCILCLTVIWGVGAICFLLPWKQSVDSAVVCFFWWSFLLRLTFITVWIQFSLCKYEL